MRPIARLLAVAALASPSAALPPAGAVRARSEILQRKATARYQAGDYDQAVRFYREWSALEPKNPLILRDMMWALWNQRRYDESGAAARGILSLRPRDPEALEMMALLPDAAARARIQELYQAAGRHMEEGRPESAVPLYRQLLVLAPSNMPIASHLLSGLDRLGRFQEGADVAATLTKARPDDPQSWNWLAQMEIGLDRRDEAVKSYQQSLRLNPDQRLISLQLGKLYVSIRDFESAIRTLEPLQAGVRDMPALYPPLAKAQYYTWRYAESARNWAKAAENFPESAEYAVYEAMALYYSGRREVALAKLRTLAFTRREPKALDFIFDDSLVRGDVAGAEALMESALATIAPKDQARVMRLAEIYEKENQPAAGLALIDRLLSVWPDNQEALVLKAELLLLAGDRKRSLETYKAVRRLNPYSTAALKGIATEEQASGRVPEALEALKALHEQSPTDPQLVLQRAVSLYAMGLRREGKRVLGEWLDKNRAASALPVLLYHGLTPDETDPILATPWHMSVSHFDDQMRAFKEAGYTAVTASQVAAWYRGKIPLPRKPVMISFDDGRLDSFVFGDPVLKKYGFKATMFAAVVNIEGHRPPGYVSWETYRRYQETGRWEIQAHGDLAHIYIPVGPNGEAGLFLINRRWLDAEKRLETVEEWKERIAEDYESGKRKIFEHLGQVVDSFAYPQGYYGQNGISNEPTAAPVNRELVAKSYKVAYIQDDCGLNTGTQDPPILTRFIAHNDWMGSRLLRHFEESSPVNQMEEQRLDWAVAERRPREALDWLAALKSSGVDPSKTLAKEAEIRLAFGDAENGLAVARRALMNENVPQLQPIVSSFTAQELGWTPSYAYERDDQGRRNWLFDQTLDVRRVGAVTWSLRHRHGEYRQDGVPGVTDDAGGVAAAMPLGLFHRVSAEAMGHFLSGSARDTYSLDGELRSKWTDDLETRLQAGRALYTASASSLDSNILSVDGDLFAGWTQHDGPWKASTGDRLARLSDENRRLTAWVEVSRSVFDSELLRGVYRFTYDDMNFPSPMYYSPHRLREQQAGPELRYSRPKAFSLSVRYLPGYAQENGRPDGFTHTVEGSALWNISDRLALNPSADYFATPSYNYSRYMLQLEYRY